jgi:uncharacterized 2Fe-2S/4Fe-4S cluster protein (DUF4445 family)
MPQTQQIYIELNPPSLKDNTAVIDRLAKGLRSQTGLWPQVALRDLERFAGVLRGSNYRVTALLQRGSGGPVVVDLRPGDATNERIEPDLVQRAKALPMGLWGDQGLGLALDIGSTHLAGALLDLASGQELARDNQLNPQTRIGADILTRIQAAADKGVKQRLHREMVHAANELTARLCESAGRGPFEITGICAAGNTTMTHFFLDLDTQSICREPYIPLINRPAPFYASELGIEASPRAVLVFAQCGLIFRGRSGGRDRGRRSAPPGGYRHHGGCGHQCRGGGGQPGLAFGLRRGGWSGPGGRGGQDGGAGRARGHRGGEHRSCASLEPLN